MTQANKELYECHLFRGLSAAITDEIMLDSVNTSYEPGTILIRKGEIPRSLFIIKSGRVGIYSEDILLAELSELTIMGESLLANTMATATTIAQSFIDTVEFSPELFHSLALKYPQIVLNIFSITMHRLRNSNEAAMDEAHNREAVLKDQVEKRTEELNHTLEELRYTQKFKDQFLANMSHEIRTPMNAVLGMTNLTLETPLSDKQKKYLNAIQKSSENLLVIINDILDLSKLQAGKMELENITFRINDPLEQVLDTLRFKAEEKGLALSYKLESDVPEFVKGDPARLVQILINLSGNAIKFTDRGSVRIQVSTDTGGSVRFSVKDTGIGIPEDKIELLFNAFQQVDASTSRKYGGTGLGLSISKTLVELQEGTLHAISESGKGSEFYFKIPYLSATTEEMEAIRNDKNLDFNKLSGIQILVAEDNEFNQIVLNDTLEMYIDNVDIDMAENGLVVLEKLRNNSYDIILMDNQMPEMDGMETTRYIREKLEAPVKDIPIIALTASVLPSDIRMCLEAGMNAVIPKPFELGKMMRTLSRYYTSSNSS